MTWTVNNGFLMNDLQPGKRLAFGIFLLDTRRNPNPTLIFQNHRKA